MRKDLRIRSVGKPLRLAGSTLGHLGHLGLQPSANHNATRSAIVLLLDGSSSVDAAPVDEIPQVSPAAAGSCDVAPLVVQTGHQPAPSSRQALVKQKVMTRGSGIVHHDHWPQNCPHRIVPSTATTAVPTPLKK